MRHAFASVHGANGAAPEVISAQLGHARLSFTLDRYRSALQRECDDLTPDLAALMKPKAKQVEETPPATMEV